LFVDGCPARITRAGFKLIKQGKHLFFLRKKEVGKKKKEKEDNSVQSKINLRVKGRMNLGYFAFPNEG
jgi:hypothetical protein